MKLTNLIANIPAAQSGGTVSFFLPVGVRHHGFRLFLSSSGTRTAVTSTNLTRVRVLVDTVLLIDWDWVSIQSYALRRGITLAVGEIPIFFTDPLLVGLRNSYAGSIDTKQGITNIQVTVQLGTITTPTLAGLYTFDNISNVMPRMVGGKRVMVPFNTPIKKYTQTENIPTGTYSITDISNGYPLDTVTLTNGADAQITYLELNLNSVKIFEGAPSDIARELLDYGILTPIGTIVLPFTYDRFSPVSAAGFTNIEIRLTSAGAFAAGVTVEVQLPSIT